MATSALVPILATRTIALTQTAFRFYEDGSESGSSPIAAENTGIARLVDSNSNLHLRLLIQESAGVNGLTTDDWQLQYSKNGGGYTSVTTSTSNVKAFASASTTDAGVTINRPSNGITDGTGSFVAGEVSETGLITDRQITASNFTEHLFTLTLVAADLANSDTLDFRLLFRGVTMTYTVTPTVTVNKTGTFTQAAYRFYEDGTESSSTAIDAQNTDIVRDLSGGDANLQLRVRVQEDGVGTGLATDDYQLQYELNDSGSYYSVANIVSGAGVANLDNNNKGRAQTFIGDGNSISTVSFMLSKAVSPTGNATAKIYAITGTYGVDSRPTGSALATSDAFDVSTLTTTPTLSAFTFSSPYATSLGTNYAVTIEYASGDATNKVVVMAVGDAYTGNFSFMQASTWFNGGTGDLAVQINGAYLMPVLGFNSGSLTDGNATTNRLGSGTGSFVAGEISEDGLVDDLQITSSNYTELLYSLTLESTAVADGDTIDFRVLRNGLTTGMTYTVMPRITIDISGGDAHTLVTQDMALALTEDATTINQNHVLTAQDIAHALTEDSTTITQNHVVASADIALALTEDNTTLATNHVLPVDDIALALSEDNATITQNHIVATQDMALALTEDNGTVTETNHNLTVQDVALALSEDNTTVEEEGDAFTLLTNDIALALSEDNTSLAQNHVLPTQDIALALAEDNTTVTETNFSLATQDIALALSEDGTTVVQTNFSLTAQDMTLSLSEDATTITQNHVLTPQDAALALTEDNTTVVQTNFALTVQDAALGLSVDNTSMSQNHVLASDDMLINTSLESTSMSLAGDLNAQDASLSLTMDNTTITQNHVLAVQDMALALTEDEPALAQNHVIASADMALSTTTDNSTITQAHVLTPQDVQLDLTTDNTTVEETNFALDTDDIQLSLRADHASLQGELVEAKKYYIDTDGNVYWVLNQALGLIEKV